MSTFSLFLPFITPIILVTIYNFLIKKNHYIFGYIFILYLSVALSMVAGFPSISELLRLHKLGELIIGTNVNFIPFNNGINFSDTANIIFFIPLGFLLPFIFSKFKSLFKTLTYGFIFSLLIEVGQLFTLYRATDIDDLIMNTIGTFLGWTIFKLIKFNNYSYSKTTNDYNSLFKLEPYLYILFAFVGTFFS